METEHPAVTNFRRYLRIPSVHPNVNYDECVTFLTTLAKEIGLSVKTIEVCVGKPIVIMTRQGENPELPSLLLNSHMDVVPVYAENWKYHPFEAVKDENGDIYARGTQDVKCIGIQYLETIRKYINEGLRFKRTIHVSFVPDEEIGGAKGMGMFVKTQEFHNLNIGFCLDEGGVGEADEFCVFYAERSICQIFVTCCGNTGHGSLLHENTAAEKVQYIINKFLEYREKEKRKLLFNPDLMIGDVTSINMTMLQVSKLSLSYYAKNNSNLRLEIISQGGVQLNVVPPEMTIGFDIRLALDVDHEKFLAMIDSWCKEAGDDVRYKFEIKGPYVAPTPIDESNLWWIAFKSEINKMGLKIKPIVCPGITDARYIREIGIPAIGFIPVNYTPILAHAHNEFINEKTFLCGLDIYYNVIKSLASIDKEIK